MNSAAEIVKDIFYLNNTACLSRLKYFFYNLSVKVICLTFIIYVFYTYKISANGVMSIFWLEFFIFVILLLLYADFNLTVKRWRDVGVPFPYGMSSIIFILFTTYLTGFEHHIVRWLVITVSMIPYALPTGMIKKG